MTFPARIGHLTGGQIRSIALHQATHETGELLARYLTNPNTIAAVIARGDIQRFDTRNGTTFTAIFDPQGAPPINHADNAWPPGAQCLYLHQQDTWWKRTANQDGTWPDTWTPINKEQT